MRRIALIAIAVALFLPSAAMAAGSSTCQAYNPQLCSSVGGTTATSGSEATLPFTGVDVVLLAAGGVTLLGAGFVVRVLAKKLN
jgi:hypothetical protein